MSLSDRPLRILQFTTNFKQGGIQRHILDVTNSGTGTSTLGRLKAAFQTSQLLRRILKEREIDLIHSHETAPALVAKLALRTSKLPKVITYHGSAPSRTQQFARVSRYCADMVVSPSQTTLNELIDFGVPNERTRVLGLGIDAKPEPSADEVARIRSSLSLKPTDILCLSLSRLDFQKGIDIMIDVAKQVLSQNPHVVFAVGGTGPLADEVQGWADAAGVSERFKFMGSVSEVQNYLAASDIFLLTSRWEALPISIVEAFRAGLPVIATNCGGVKELVDDEVGRLCQVGDVDALASAILEISGNVDLRNQLAQASLEKSASTRFDPFTVHEAFEKFYLDLVR